MIEPEVRDRRYWRIVIWLPVLVTIAVAIARPRNSFEAPHILDLIGSYSANTKADFGLIAYRVSMIALALIPAFCVSSRLLRLPRMGHSGGIALFAAGAFSSVAFIISAIWGTVPEFSPGLIVWPTLFASIWLAPPVDKEWILSEICWSLRLVIAGSLLSCAVAYNWAVDADYTAGVIPGFSIRLHGLNQHANGLGPLSAFLLLIELFGQRQRRWSWVFAAFAVLILSQSKTTMLAAAFATAPMMAALLSDVARRGVTRGLSATLLLLYIVSVGLVIYISGDASDTASLTNSADNVRSLTGRTDIWMATIETWKDAPLVGYGPSLWDDAMQDRYQSVLGWRAPHAHSQLFQSLGQSGLLGLAGWLMTLGAMIWTATSLAPPRQRLFCLGWVVFILVSSASESWFRRDGLAAFPGLLLITIILQSTTYHGASSPPKLPPREMDA